MIDTVMDVAVTTTLAAAKRMIAVRDLTTSILREVPILRSNNPTVVIKGSNTL